MRHSVLVLLVAAGSLVKGETRVHYLLRFSGRAGPAVKRELSAHGVAITGELPGSGLVVAAPDSLDWDALGLGRAARLAPSEKLSPYLEEAATGAYVVEFHADVPSEVQQRLVGAAHLDRLDHRSLLRRHLLITGPMERVQSLADRDEVAYIFPASEALLSAEPVLACPGPLGEDGPVGQYVKASPGWPATGPAGVDLQYAFAALSEKLPASAQESEILRALLEWSKYLPLRFTPGDDATGPRTIAILFAHGAHGDGYPFDGQGKILAHTFYPAPPNREPIAGDLHLDAEENWQIGRDTDLYTVVLHEAGHALGLGYSDLPSSVMYPYYRFGAAFGRRYRGDSGDLRQPGCSSPDAGDSGDAIHARAPGEPGAAAGIAADGPEHGYHAACPAHQLAHVDDPLYFGFLRQLPGNRHGQRGGGPGRLGQFHGRFGNRGGDSVVERADSIASRHEPGDDSGVRRGRQQFLASGDSRAAVTPGLLAGHSCGGLLLASSTILSPCDPFFCSH
jgi:hypothetical protein